MIEFTIDDDTSLNEIIKFLHNKGVVRIDYKKLFFVVNEGGYGAVTVVKYDEEIS